MPRNKGTIIIIGLFLAGLALRLPLLFTQTTTDLDAFLIWGTRALERGLALGFQGTYFPLEWQIFSFCALIGKATSLDFHFLLKLLSLLFDVGNFFLIIAILKKLKCNIFYSLIYWFHPWFLTIFSFGYVDFRYTFLILLFVYILLRGDDFKHYFWAGLPLGIAILLKPQVEILVFSALVYALISFVKYRKLKAFAVLIFPAAFLFGYEIYFFLERWPVKGPLKALVILPYYYLTIQNVKPQLTAQMLNFWYPIVYFIREPGADFYINSNIYILPFIKAKTLATLVVFGALSFYSYLVRKKNAQPESGLAYLLIFAFASTIVPFLMTSAHENHLFLATVLLLIILAKYGGRLLWISFLGLLFIQFINVYLIYTYDYFGLWLQKYYTYETRTILAIISVVLFIIVLRGLVKINGKTGIQNNA